VSVTIERPTRRTYRSDRGGIERLPVAYNGLDWRIATMVRELAGPDQWVLATRRFVANAELGRDGLTPRRQS
jgi:hypothetical protein